MSDAIVWPTHIFHACKILRLRLKENWEHVDYFWDFNGFF